MRVALILLAAFGTLVIVGALTWLVTRYLSSDSLPFLIIFIFSVVSFIFIFNRIDIANMLAIPGAIIVADITYRIYKSNRLGMVLGSFFLAGIMAGPLVSVANKFEHGYPFDKNIMIEMSNIYDDINEGIGGYSDNVKLYVNDRSLLVQPFMSYTRFKPYLDLSHFNIWHFRDTVIRDGVIKQFSDEGIPEFIHKKILGDNVQVKIVKLKPNEISTKDDMEAKQIYVDETNQVHLL